MAMASWRAEDVSRQAVRLNPYEDILAVLDVPLDQGNMRLQIEDALKEHHPEITVRCRQRCFSHFSDEPLCAKAVTDEVGNRDDLEIVLRGKLNQVRHARHGAVFLHDFANDTCWAEACGGRQIHRCFSLP